MAIDIGLPGRVQWRASASIFHCPGKAALSTNEDKFLHMHVYIFATTFTIGPQPVRNWLATDKIASKILY